jgi:hypothetical protein
MKMCAKCEITKPYEDFNKNKTIKDGHSSYCKKCQKEYFKNWHNKNYKRKHPKEKFINGKRYCTICKNYKELNSFRSSKISWCASCHTEYDRKRNDEKRKFPRKINDSGKIHCRNCGKYFSEDQMKQVSSGKRKGLTYCVSCSPLLSRTRLVEKYGITLDQYHQMLEDQEYACKICNKEEKTNKARLSIDHNHDCCPGGKSCGSCVRGLLCTNCNMSLGNAQDSIEILQKMIDYLKSYQK